MSSSSDTASELDGSADDILIPLDAERSMSIERAGGKAAALAQALRAGLPVPPGGVVPVGAVHDLDQADVKALWTELSSDAQVRLVARSSSPIEDTADESMAGRFESVTGIDSPDALRDAIGVVRDSAAQIADQRGEDVPIAVLIQRQVEPDLGGVLFTIDPRTGKDHLVISVAGGGPEPLVSGETEGRTFTVQPDDASVLDVEGEGPDLDDQQRRALCELGREMQDLFDGPQDIEWAIDTDGELWLLQSRPVTGIGRPAVTVDQAEGRIYGPGPVAETFPDPIGTLERDLWIPPLRQALEVAFRHIGGVTEDDLAASEIVVWVDGRVGVDLELFGISPREEEWWRKLDPRRGFRKLRASWHMGKLRSSIPHLGGQVCRQIDDFLSAAPPLQELSDRQLVGLLDRGQIALRAIHGHEVLVGVLIDVDRPTLTGASVALRVLSTARADGYDDDRIVRDHPVVLALSGPRIRLSPDLPETPELPTRPVSGEEDDENAILREALRLRARWVQELQARAVLELAARLRERDQLEELEHVRWLQLRELRAAVEDRAVVIEAGREQREIEGRPLPSAFVFDEDGDVARVATGEGGSGTGAGGGTGTGPVHLGEDPAPGDVLIVRTLDPALGTIVDQLGGLVSETGSVLSHVAILAREAGVPVVVGADGARDSFESGQRVTVDGDNGTVRVDEEN